MHVIQGTAAREEMEEQEGPAAEPVGALSRRVAHDFNNLLTTILGYSELLAAGMTDGPEAEYLDIIRRSAERGAALTRDLLNAGRPSE